MGDKVEYWSDIAERDPAVCIASGDDELPHKPYPTGRTEDHGDQACIVMECSECGQQTCIPMPLDISW